jgi:hypothetical protein
VVKKNNTSQNQPKKDRSAYDWAVARSLIERGKTDNEIFNYLKEKSTKGAQRGDKYIENTIKRARGKTI